MNITIILEARLIPDGSRVHKPRGEKLYTLRRELKFYQHSFSVRDEYGQVHGFSSLVAPSGVFLLSDNGGDVITMQETEKLAIDMQLESAIHFLETVRISEI